MRKTLLFLLLLCTKLTFAQLNDNFSDGDFTNNPTWGGSTTSFQILDGWLKSNGPQAASTLYLTTPNTLATKAVWEFNMSLNFDPSTTNYPRIYLVSNKSDIVTTTGLQGYYLQLGSSTSAENFSLVRQNGATVTTVLALPDKSRPSASTVNVRVKVERDLNGRWDIYTDFTGGNNFTHDGFVIDNTYTTSTHFGVYCRYATTSRFDGFRFTDFKIYELIDNTPPAVLSVKSLSDKSFEVVFDEPVDQASALLASNYILSNNVGSPVLVENGGTASSVKITYANDIESGNYTLSVANIADVRGNIASTPRTKSFLHIKSYTAKKGDVVINEIMAAPIASAPALNKEYIELWNTTDKYIIITGWKYKDASTSIATFAADTLAPKEYRIVCATADVAAFKVYGKTLGISPWPTLNNDKDDLSLMLPDGSTIIDAVSYVDTWYQDNAKKTGYALELINPNSPCGGAFNWTASTGTNNGTPGAQNSVYNPQHIDNVAPKLLSVTILSTTSVQVDFSKSINVGMLTDVNNYFINNGIGKPSAIQLNGTSESSVILTLTNAIVPNTESLLTVTNLANCAGIPIDPTANTATILITGAINANDILISEILFNPKTGGFDFVELYNPTNRILDLKDLTLSNPTATGTTGPSKRTITTTSVFIRPKTYWVLTASPEVVKQHYQVEYPNQMVQIASMPAYNNDKGTVAIWKGDDVIDQVAYTEKMHHPLLKEVKGVSLERVSFTKSGNEPGNLQSAAASVGFATPTDVNSQQEDTSVKNSVTLANKTFSPDNDGFEDQLNIDYRFKENGNLATINIYTDKGVLVRKLVRNITFSTQGTVTWDGLNDGGQLCKVGLYVVKVDIFNVNGTSDSFKQTCVLASKLN
ncbi:lamin tail domain-containing protein [Pedobacter sp. ASV28]|uniref:lamin tail domain-containing protein n=1 Tax=Pedobacter sp. ASV28 TaxID=2795123 RepID=UPI0018ED5024|nr:lamin tail domain-containing protein [Pedobacter sp. ASV28]